VTKKLQLATAVALVGLLAGAISAYSASAQRSALHYFSSDFEAPVEGFPIVPGSSSLLMRSGDEVWMRITTQDLPPAAYTVWWVVFNDPSACKTPVATLTFTLLFQAFHVLEHVIKMVQYIQLGFQNGTGGILGMGPGGLAPLFPIPLLHLAYNAITYFPSVLAFTLLRPRPPVEDVRKSELIP